MRNLVLDESMRPLLLRAIELLLSEGWAQAPDPMPDTLEGLWQLFRALLIERPAQAANMELLDAQDAVLSKIEYAGEEVDVRDLTPAAEVEGGKLFLWQGDVTALRVDGLAFETSQDLLGSFDPSEDSVDNDITSAAGIQARLDMQHTLESFGANEEGRGLIVSFGGNLSATFTLRFPYERAAEEVLTEEDLELVRERYRQILEMADGHECRYVAIAPIATTAHGFDYGKVAQVAVETVAEELPKIPGNRPLHNVVFVVTNDEERACFERALRLS